MIKTKQENAAIPPNIAIILNFFRLRSTVLSTMTAKEQNYLPSAANSIRLDIIIVGAGMGGLSASIECALSGHHVTVLEAARELAEVHNYRDCFYSKPIKICGDANNFSRSAPVSK